MKPVKRERGTSHTNPRQGFTDARDWVAPGSKWQGAPIRSGLTENITFSLHITTSLQTAEPTEEGGCQCLPLPVLSFVKVNTFTGAHTKQCCKAGAGLPQTEAMQLSWPLLPGQLELDLGSRPAQTRKQGMTSWKTDRHQGCTQSEAPKGQRGRTQGVGCRGKSDHHHPHPTSWRDRGSTTQKSRRGDREAPENIILSAGLSTLVQMNDILPKVSGCPKH